MAASLTIGTIAAIVGTAGSVGGGTYSAVQSRDAEMNAQAAKNQQEGQLYAQQQAAQDATTQANAKQAAIVALARQRTLQAGAGGNYGGTLGTGASGGGAPYGGGMKTALGQ